MGWYLLGTIVDRVIFCNFPNNCRDRIWVSPPLLFNTICTPNSLLKRRSLVVHQLTKLGVGALIGWTGFLWSQKELAPEKAVHQTPKQADYLRWSTSNFCSFIACIGCDATTATQRIVSLLRCWWDARETDIWMFMVKLALGHYRAVFLAFGEVIRLI